MLQRIRRIPDYIVAITVGSFILVMGQQILHEIGYDSPEMRNAQRKALRYTIAVVGTVGLIMFVWWFISFGGP